MLGTIRTTKIRISKTVLHPPCKTMQLFSTVYRQVKFKPGDGGVVVDGDEVVEDDVGGHLGGDQQDSEDRKEKDDLFLCRSLKSKTWICQFLKNVRNLE